MFLDFFRKYLFSARAGSLVKRISWLSVMGLTVSISSLVIVISVMTALNHNIEDRTLAVEPHLTIEIPGINQGALLESHPLTAKLRAMEGFRADVYESQDVILRTLDGHFRGAVARGLNQKSIDQMLFQMQRMDRSKKGEPLMQEILAPGEILVGIDLAISLGVFEGDSLLVVPPESLLLPPTEAPKFERVRVKKIISTNLADVDAQNIFYNREHTLGSLRNSASRKTGIEVFTPQPKNVDQYLNEFKTFPEARVQTWKERNSALFFALRLEKLAITLFLSIAALIASFSMISVLVLLISQKRREIGILQTLGFSVKRIQILFRNIGLCLAGMGLIAGSVIGSLISYYIEKNPLEILPNIYYDSKIPAYLDGGFVLSIVLLGCGFAIFGSSLASRGAALTQPADALRLKN